MYILTLREALDIDIARIGGKAGALARLYSSGENGCLPIRRT